MKKIEKMFCMFCMGIIPYMLTSCNNEDDLSVNAVATSQVKADIMELADNEIEYIECNGLKWAPGNLTNVDGVYKILKSQYEIGSFWQTGFDRPDPCKSVSPINTWRLPRMVEFQSLLDAGMYLVAAEGLRLDELLLVAKPDPNHPDLYTGLADYMTSDYTKDNKYCYCLTLWPDYVPQISGFIGQYSIRCVMNE